jgi:hypothetical protein
MSVPSHRPNGRSQLDALVGRVAALEEQLRKGFAHALEDHTNVDLQGAAAADALARGEGAIWGPGTAGGSTVLAIWRGLPSPDNPVPAGGDRMVNSWTKLYGGGETFQDILRYGAAVIAIGVPGIVTVSPWCFWLPNGLAGTRGLRASGSQEGVVDFASPIEEQVADPTFGANFGSASFSFYSDGTDNPSWGHGIVYAEVFNRSAAAAELTAVFVEIRVS